MGQRKPELSEAEFEVLRALWAIEAGTVREANAVLARWGRRWAYTTVQTLLGRLKAKGYVQSESGGSAHVFRPVASREEILRDRLDALADQLCDGESTPLVLALVEGRQFSDEQIAQFRALVDRLEEAATDRRAPG